MLAMHFNLQSCDPRRPIAADVPERRIVLVDRRWGASLRGHAVDERTDVELLFGGRICSVLFSEDPYELLEIGRPSLCAGTSVMVRRRIYIRRTKPRPPRRGPRCRYDHFEHWRWHAR